MKNIVSDLMKEMQTFTVLDVGIFKACLIFFGMVVGLAAGERGKKYIPALLLAFFSCWFYLAQRIFFIPKLRKNQENCTSE